MVIDTCTYIGHWPFRKLSGETLAEKAARAEAVAAMKALGLEGRVALVIADDAVNTYLSFRNIPKVNIIPVSDINTYELIDNKKLVVTADALKYIEEVLA